jgi:hypothetical protein
MTEERPPDEQAADAALAALAEAFSRSAEAIGKIANPHHAFESATELAGALRELADKAAELRAQMVERIWAAEEMSLATLAGRIGVSKARADQLLKTARAKKETPNG